VALIKVGFRVFAGRSITAEKDSIVLEDDVFVRVAVPTNPQDGPECF
jgi:hypothetical protein